MSDTLQQRGFEAVRTFLSARGLHPAVIEHAQTFTANADARIAAVPPDHAAKAVMVRDDDGYVLAIVPSSRALSLHRLRKLTQRPRLRLATETELARDFPRFEVGALPPFGELFDCPEYIDHRLLAEPRVLCNGGDHRHSIVMSTTELRLASGALAADLADNADARPVRPAAR